MTSRRNRTLSDDEADLWRRATRDDKPIASAGIALPEPKRPPRRQAERQGPPEPVAAPPAPRGRSLDAALETRLRRGRLPLEGSIDLHGLTLREAEDRLGRYIAGAFAMRKRCILVVTGKGALPPAPHERDYMPERPRPGAIRAALPRWLMEGPASGCVLAFFPAQPQHGGGGAFYVLLRRQKSA